MFTTEDRWHCYGDGRSYHEYGQPGAQVSVWLIAFSSRPSWVFSGAVATPTYLAVPYAEPSSSQVERFVERRCRLSPVER